MDDMVDMDGQNEFLSLIFCNNLDELSILLQTNKRIKINYMYGGPFNNKTVLEIACCEFISVIRQSTIRFLLQNRAEGNRALYYAACEYNVDIVQELIRNNISFRKNPILILLIKYINNHNLKEEKYVEIVKILAEKVEINLEDEAGCTAVYLAAKYGYNLLVDIILYTRKEEIDLDNYKHTIFKTARDIIEMTMPRTLPKPVINFESDYITLKSLLKNIRQKQEIEFLSNYKIFKQNHFETLQEDNNVLLLFAAEKGLTNIVRYFLYIGVDSNRIFKYFSELFPLKYACLRGYYKVVEVLLQYANYKTVNISLIELVKSKFEESATAKINHYECLQLLLENEHIDFSFRDKNENTVSHYAAMHQNSEIIQLILRKGGSLACKNNVGKMTIEFLDAMILEKHFDDCIHFIKFVNVPNRHLVEINFKSMIPDRDILCFNHSMIKNCDHNNILIESEILQFISKKKEFKHLLQHPVIEMFLFLKWQSVKKFIFINLMIYMLFMALLFMFIYFKTKTMDSDLQWIGYYINKLTLIVFLLILILREIIQIFIFRVNYLKQFENYIEACLFGATIALIFIDCSTEIKNQLSALIIVTSSVELMLLSGRHFRILFVSSIMLQTVSKTLFKWLLSYILLITSFSFCFYYIFYEQRYFKNIYISLFKTIVMITGEFELENLQFAPNYTLGPLLFIVFVFLVNIVLLGVCTALAINDIQMIINEAEIKLQINQIQHIVYWESTLYTSKIFHFGNWLKKILKITLIQEDPLIKIRIINDFKTIAFKITDIYEKLEIDSQIVKNIIAKTGTSRNYYSMEYPPIDEKFFFNLRKTLSENEKRRSNIFESTESFYATMDLCII